MGADGGVLGLGVCGEVDGDRRRQFARFPAPVESAAHGIGMRSAVAEGFQNGLAQFGGAVTIEQVHQGRGRTEILVARRGADQEVAAGGNGLDEPVRGPLPASGALLFDKRLDV